MPSSFAGYPLPLYRSPGESLGPRGAKSLTPTTDSIRDLRKASRNGSRVLGDKRRRVGDERSLRELIFGAAGHRSESNVKREPSRHESAK